jgi:hypothetical protein
MKTSGLRQNLGRTALALTTAIALILPLNSAVLNASPVIRTGAEKETNVNQAFSADSGVRMDGVAASLVTRPASSLSSSERRDLAGRYSDRIIARNTDLEAFAATSDFTAVLAAGDVDEFVMTLSYLTLDATNNWTAIAAGPLTRLRQRIHNLIPTFPGSEALLRYGSQGFAVDDKSNQAQHFWYSVAITYKWGAGVAEVVARYHEWNPPALLRWLPGTGKGSGSEGDLYLSHQGMALGRMLRDGSIRPEGVGEWMREELGA